MPEVHPTAVVSPGAELGDHVTIGPYCIVGEHVRIGEHTQLRGHVVVDGHTTIGASCDFFPFASVGSKTQDLKFAGGAPRLEIGDRTTIRESVTLNVATADGDVTKVGSDCLLMAFSHVAHDCQLGDGVILANCGTLAGHVILEDHVIIGGLSGVHQFVKIGAQTMIGGCSKVTQDVPPFMMADGNPLAVRGINAVGLKRRGVSLATLKQIKEAFRILYRSELSTSKAVARIESEISGSPEIKSLLEFVSSSERGISH